MSLKTKKGNIKKIGMKWDRQKDRQTRGAFNRFPDFFVQAFKIVVDSWEFSILLLYISWDDLPISLILGINE